jgi:Fe-S oxidoreductase
LLNLFPTDPRAKRLASAALTLGEFIEREGDRFQLPRLDRKVLVQAHCHHAAIMKFGAEEKVLKKLGLDVEHPDSGCCGMAGAFGFEEKNLEISLRIGERVLLPKVRSAAKETLIVADGFSCREQIAQTTDREALHLAQVLQMAMHATGGPEAYPEKRAIEPRPLVPNARKVIGVASGVALFAGGVALLRKWRRN